MTEMTKNDILRVLRLALVNLSQAELARRIGVSRSFLCEVVNGKRRPTGKILTYLGVKERVTYIKTGERK